MLRTLRRLIEFSAAERLLLLQLFILSLVMETGLRLLPLPRLVRFLSIGANTTLLQRLPLLHKTSDWTRLAVLADLAARVTRGQGRCLVRSLLRFWLLRIRGESAELLIGVSREASVLHAHAWIEAPERTVGESAETAGRFTPLLRFSVKA